MKYSFFLFTFLINYFIYGSTNNYSSLTYSYLHDSLIDHSTMNLSGELEYSLKEMKFIPEGTFTMGNIDFLKPENCDSTLLLWNRPFRVSVSSFLISEYEITNKQYKEFVNWVRDSLTKVLTGKTPEITKIIYKYSATADGINVYPDTSVWINDFKHSFFEKMESQYFQNPDYDNFPVVGITWLQAHSYCIWKSRLLAELLKKHNINTDDFKFSLPTEAEWEYAAKSAKTDKTDKQDNISERRKFPWKGHQMTNCNGGYYANYGQSNDRNNLVIKAISDDGYLILSEVKKYPPNDAGLYDMAGNASEWTMDIARKIRLTDWLSNESGNTILPPENLQITSNDNPHTLLNKIIKYTAMIPGAEKYDTLTIFRKEILLEKTSLMLHDWIIMNNSLCKHIVKGGSWADSPAYLLCGSRQVYYENKGSSKIGFRIVLRMTDNILPYFNNFIKNLNIYK